MNAIARTASALAALLALAASPVSAPGRDDPSSPPAPSATPAVTEGATPSRPLRDLPTEGELRELLPLFETPATRAGEPFTWRLERTRETDAYVRYELTFPSAFASGNARNDVVHARYFAPHGAGPHPAAVVLHWLGGSLAALELVCANLAQNGVGALMIYMPHYGPRRTPEGRRELMTVDGTAGLDVFRQAVLDVRRAGDWLAARPEVDPARVGILGISLGAIVGTLTAGVDPSFARIALLIGGGDLAAIALNGARELRNLRREIDESGLTYEQLRALWRPIEPLTYASRIDPAKVLMINADEDEIFPRRSIEALRDAIGLAEIQWFPGGHYDILKQMLVVIPRSALHLRGE